MSFSGLVDSFNEHQKQGLQAVPANRLLLETDLTPNAYTKGRFNTPRRIGEVATLVSQVRQEPLSQVLETANVNFRGQGHAGRDCDVTSGTTRLGRREASVLIQLPKVAVYISKLARLLYHLRRQRSCYKRFGSIINNRTNFIVHNINLTSD
ncbi:D-aminoacyl-tRNA deacylase [Plakobranchus ocellatus]|uniref:D-aminoacyl-tRNA deacylase n=1 Tax=Plakobranchus ocellatus TaxID=259542 RepID=A0AAV4CNA9_9GAST|nr:D-aminoacyl-tRNA deacylase [Plakobranchus ocellatus]